MHYVDDRRRAASSAAPAASDVGLLVLRSHQPHRQTFGICYEAKRPRKVHRWRIAAQRPILGNPLIVEHLGTQEAYYPFAIPRPRCCGCVTTAIWAIRVPHRS